jgi:DNA-binding Lrp family transcriptional regulator
MTQTDLPTELPHLDTLDRRIVAALQVDGRVPWGRMAAVLNESERTIARRAERLIAGRYLRVIGFPETQRAGLGDAVLVTFAGDSAHLGRLAESLASHPRVRMVAVSAGQRQLDSEWVWDEASIVQFLADFIDGAGSGIRYYVHSVLRCFKLTHEWRLVHDLTDTEVLELQGSEVSKPFGDLWSDDVQDVTPDELQLMGLLHDNGRISNVDLASALGLSAATVRRRLSSLRQRGLLMIRAEMEPRLLGYEEEGVVWLTCDFGEVERIGKELAAIAEARYVVATTGAFQVVGHFLHRDKAAFYTALTTDVAKINGIRTAVTELTVATIKRGFVRRDNLLLRGESLDVQAPSAVERRTLLSQR